MRTRLKEARRAAGLSQKEAAQLFGVSIGTYRNWEQGRVVMNGEQLISAARLFNTDVDFILMTDDVQETDELIKREINDLLDELNSDGREVLLIVARGLLDKFAE